MWDPGCCAEPARSSAAEQETRQQPLGVLVGACSPGSCVSKARAEGSCGCRTSKCEEDKISQVDSFRSVPSGGVVSGGSSSGTETAGLTGDGAQGSGLRSPPCEEGTWFVSRTRLVLSTLSLLGGS